MFGGVETVNINSLIIRRATAEDEEQMVAYLNRIGE